MSVLCSSSARMCLTSVRAQCAMALTSRLQKAGFPLTLELGGAGLPRQSWVKISQVRTLSVERIGKKIGTVSRVELAQAIEGLNEIIGA